MEKLAKNMTVVGAGLVGSLWAVYLAKAGFKVNVFERRPDMRLNQSSAGKSINLALSYRGWKALDDIGIGDSIREIALPMLGRTMHHLDGSTTYQPYGNNEQAIYSVSRADLNAKLMDIAEKTYFANFHFDMECVKVDADQGEAHFINKKSNQALYKQSDVVFAADGAFSAARYSSMQKLDMFDYSQQYIQDGYREILLPANNDGSYKLSKDSLHIWPRGRFMLIALPNFDGSFTCTLFMPFKNHTHCFENLKSKQQVNHFFKEVFPDFFELMPHVADAWDNHPLSSLALIRCFPWVNKNLVLLGDAAHATVPFFGQGMNAGFEDCSVLWEQLLDNQHDWNKAFELYQLKRKPNTDAMQELSLLNYVVMRDKVADNDFLLLQKVERRINFLYPQHYFPLYAMVSFTNIPYKTALDKGKEQEELIKKCIIAHHITHDSSLEDIDKAIHVLVNNGLIHS